MSQCLALLLYCASKPSPANSKRPVLSAGRDNLSFSSAGHLYCVSSPVCYWDEKYLMSNPWWCPCISGQSPLIYIRKAILLENLGRWQLLLLCPGGKPCMSPHVADHLIRPTVMQLHLLWTVGVVVDGLCNHVTVISYLITCICVTCLINVKVPL